MTCWTADDGQARTCGDRPGSHAMEVASLTALPWEGWGRGAQSDMMYKVTQDGALVMAIKTVWPGAVCSGGC